MTRRVAVTGIGVVAPGGIGARRSGTCSPRPHRDPRHHPLRPGRLPLPDRRRVRLRPGGPRPDAGGRSRARTGTSSSRWSPPGRRCATPGSTSARRGPLADRRVAWAPRSAAPPAWSTTTSLVSDGGARWDVDHRHGRPASAPAFSPEHARLRGRRAGRRRGPGADRLHRLHLRPRRGRLRLPLHRGGPGRRRASPAPPTRRSPRSPWPASTRSRRPRRTTTTRRTPPGRSTPTGTASSWARAAPCWSWRSWSTPGARGAHGLLRDRRLRHLRQRLPHDRAAPPRAWRWPRPSRAALDQARLDPTTSTTSTRTARAPSRTTGTRRPRSSGAWASTPTRCR